MGQFNWTGKTSEGKDITVLFDYPGVFSGAVKIHIEEQGSPTRRVVIPAAALGKFIVHVLEESDSNER